MKYEQAGTYEIKYKAVDECNNETILTRNVTVNAPEPILVWESEGETTWDLNTYITIANEPLFKEGDSVAIEVSNFKSTTFTPPVSVDYERRVLVMQRLNEDEELPVYVDLIFETDAGYGMPAITLASTSDSTDIGINNSFTADSIKIYKL